MVIYKNVMLKLAWLIAACIPLLASAGEVTVVDAKATKSDSDWYFSVTLEHADDGWDHYADEWRIVTPDGAVLGTRKLLHPHENEQPFTRSLGDVKIANNIDTIYIEAHDKVHGWSPDRFKLYLK